MPNGSDDGRRYVRYLIEIFFIVKMTYVQCTLFITMPCRQHFYYIVFAGTVSENPPWVKKVEPLVPDKKEYPLKVIQMKKSEETSYFKKAYNIKTQKRRIKALHLMAKAGFSF